MQFANLITLNRIECGVSASSKKRTLERISHLISTGVEGVDQNEIFDSLIAREKLGSTGLGKGIAIPHGRLKSANQTIAAFIQLEKGIDFDAPDGEPVDLLCALLVPPNCSDEHLEVLALLSEMFSKPEVRDKLRSTQDPKAIHTILTQFSSAENRESEQ
ncbi:MAG: PTS IIA-like nitrogen regulatory protein PtsN [Gammaproteobacteria bacterium]|nr:PTS IIA-like nitrogen regulatory protein PtsN [Gammaproteobacteria bacterium]